MRHVAFPSNVAAVALRMSNRRVALASRLREQAGLPAPLREPGSPGPHSRFRNAGDGAAEILIYDEIGGWDDGVNAQSFLDELAALGDVDRITLRLNSPGGDVFDGVAIYNALLNHPAAVDVRVDGLAASAASFIAQAGDTIGMEHASQMMIHDASGFACGNEADMLEAADLLGRISNTIADIYAARAGGDPDQWRTVMRGEQWYSADEAVTAGLADTAAKRPAPRGDGAPVEASARTWTLVNWKYPDREHAPDPAMPALDAAREFAAVAGPYSPEALDRRARGLRARYRRLAPADHR